MKLVRPFRWHDWFLFLRLAKRGFSLDVETSLTQGTGLRNTLLAALPADIGGLPTYVVDSEGKAAIGQLRHPPGDSHAYIAFAAPTPEDGDQELWESLLEALTMVAGERGAVNLIAEVQEGSPAFVGLRRVGFAVYARQEIWVRKPEPLADGAPSGLRPCRPADAFEATLLYSNIVPGLLRQVEPTPALAGASFVLDGEEGLDVLVVSQRGAQGCLLEAYLHPDAERRAGEAIVGALRRVDAERQPVYFRVRRHQKWLGERLKAYGFGLLGQQAMMVKHTAVRLEERVYQPLPAINGGMSASTPTPLADGLAPPPGAFKHAPEAYGAVKKSEALLTLLETYQGG